MDKSRFASQVWKCLPILELDKEKYLMCLFNIIVDMSEIQESKNDCLSDVEVAVLKKLIGLKTVSDIATFKEIRSVLLRCSNLLYGRLEDE